jgi:hypothetical protein
VCRIFLPRGHSMHSGSIKFRKCVKYATQHAGRSKSVSIHQVPRWRGHDDICTGPLPVRLFRRCQLSMREYDAAWRISLTWIYTSRLSTVLFSMRSYDYSINLVDNRPHSEATDVFGHEIHSHWLQLQHLGWVRCNGPTAACAYVRS